MEKIFHQYNRKIWMVFLASFITGIIIFSKLPPSIPVHFNAVGAVDRYGSRWTIFLAPVINVVLILLGESLRKIDPKSSSYTKFEKYYYRTIFLITLLLWSMQLLTAAYALGGSINIARILPLGVGILFVLLGNMMPKFKHNYFIGIKTSWTLASERTWYLTHRFTGKVWVVGGVCIFLSTFLPLEMILWTFLAIVFALVALSLGASYYFYRKIDQN